MGLLIFDSIFDFLFAMNNLNIHSDKNVSKEIKEIYATFLSIAQISTRI
jgi:hypothetical protein